MVKRVPFRQICRWLGDWLIIARRSWLFNVTMIVCSYQGVIPILDNLQDGNLHNAELVIPQGAVANTTPLHKHKRTFPRGSVLFCITCNTCNLNCNK